MRGLALGKEQRTGWLHDYLERQQWVADRKADKQQAATRSVRERIHTQERPAVEECASCPGCVSHIPWHWIVEEDAKEERDPVMEKRCMNHPVVSMTEQKVEDGFCRWLVLLHRWVASQISCPKVSSCCNTKGFRIRNGCFLSTESEKMLHAFCLKRSKNSSMHQIRQNYDLILNSSSFNLVTVIKTRVFSQSRIIYV